MISKKLSMTGKERIESATNHLEGDRVPYDLAGTTVTAITKNAYQNAMKMKGYSIDYDINEVDPISQIVTPIEENLVKLKSDTRRIGAHRIFKYLENRRTIGKDIWQVTDYYGCDWELDPSKDIYYNQISYPLKRFGSTSEGLNSLKTPDWEAYKNELHNDLEQQVKLIGSNCGIADRNTAGWTENSLRIRGYEEWYLDTMMDPQGVDGLLQKVLEDKIQYWDAVIDWAVKTNNQDKIQVISECDDLGSQETTIVDPGTLRTMVIPKMKILFTHVKKRLPHVKTFLHSCGSIREVIPDLIDAGLDILNPVQFTAVDMDLAGLKKDFGKDLTFWGGGIDTQSTLNLGKPQEVRDEIKRILDILAPGGGFVFAPVHNIQDDVSADNFWAMWETLQEYGKY